MSGGAVYRFEHEAMSTTFEVLIARQNADYARQVAGEVFREIDRLEKVLSRFEPGSDVSAVNRLRPGQWAPVGLEILECLNLAWQVQKETAGAFDITFASRAPSANSASGEAAVQPRVSAMQWLVQLTDDPADAKSETSANSPGFGIGVRPEAVDAGFTGAFIDLGAIGKGYALDKVFEILADYEVSDVVLNSGTSTVLALGSPTDDAGGWPLGIGGPWGTEAGLQKVRLRNRSLSGSGTEVRGQHIIDPRTGLPAGFHTAVWVAARSAALSDALSTAFYVMQPAEVAAYCATHPDISAFLVSHDPDGVAHFQILGEWDRLA